MMTLILIQNELLDSRKRGRCRRVKETTTIDEERIDR